MKSLKKLIYLLTLRERKRAGLLLGIVLIMSLLEMAGLASIVPFMAVLANPEVIETNSMLNTAFQASSIFGIENSKQFLFLLGLFVFVMLLLSLSFKAFAIYAQVRFIEMRQYTIGRRVVEGYLNQPYSWFLSRNSAELGKTILTEVSNVVNGALKQSIILIVQTAVTLSILTLLILVDPKLVLIIGLTFGLAYGLVYKLTRKFISRIGEERFKTNQFRFKALSEAFGAVKEIKLGGLEQTYIERFSHPARVMARHIASSSIIQNVPRFILEAIAFGGMLLIVLYFLTQTGDFSNTVPIISLYAFAGYRLMPALQGIYGAITALRFAGPALDSLHNELISLQPPIPQNNKDIFLKNGRFGPYLQFEIDPAKYIEIKKKKSKKENNNNLKNVSIPKGISIESIDLDKAKFLCSLPKIIGTNPENQKEIVLNSGRFGPYLKCENKSARIENVEEIFSIGLNRAITLISEAKPGRISSSLIKDLGEHPEDKKPVRIMKGQYGPYIKYKSLNATIPEEKDPIELTMEDALILIEKRKEYDKSKKKKRK